MWVISLYVYDIWVLESYPIIYQQQNPIKEVEIRVLVSIYFSSKEPIPFFKCVIYMPLKIESCRFEMQNHPKWFPGFISFGVFSSPFISVMGKNRWNGKNEKRVNTWVLNSSWTLDPPSLPYMMTNKNVCKCNQSIQPSFPVDCSPLKSLFF